MPSSSSLVNCCGHDEGVIVEIQLNRPDARNALNQAVLDELRAAVRTAAEDAAVRVIVLSGVGKAFCAGMDLRAVRAMPEQMGDLLMTLSRLMREIRRAAQPTIACVQGAAVGGGCGLMSVCDFAFTHPSAKIGYPEVGLGVCPAVVAPWLVRRLGAGRARQLLLAGGTITGEAGYQIGLVTHVADLDDLHDEAMHLARDLVRGGAKAIAITKDWLNQLDGSMDDAILDEAARLSARVLQGEEAQGRLAAYFEGRK